MNVFDAIRLKRAVRKFKDEPLPEETILAILNAGRRAQSSKNTQPWHFIAVTNKATLKQFFSGLRGIIILDTLGNANKLESEVKGLHTSLEILETRQVGCENVKNVVNEAIERNKQKRMSKII